MFKHSCFIENSKEAREWLESIGISHNPFDNELYVNPWIIANHGMYISIDIISKDNLKYFYKEDINCLGNLPLFKALTAVRDDNDYMQWFVCDLCFFDEPLEDRMILCEKDNHNYLRVYSSFHKATKEELIEKFKSYPNKYII